MNPGARRIPLRNILGIFTAVVLLIALAGWLWLRSVESRRWARMEQRVAQLRAENDARCGPRPVLRGLAIPGDAWDDYLPALTSRPSFKESEDAARYAGRDPKADRLQALRVVDAFGAALNGIRQGTRRASCRRSRLHEKEAPSTVNDLTPLGNTLSLAALACAKSRFLQEDGRLQEAIELLLDMLQFAEDIGRDGSGTALFHGLLVQQIVLSQLKEIVWDERCTRAQLEFISDRLEFLDREFPRHERALLGQLEFFGQLLLGDSFSGRYLKAGEAVPQEYQPSWRHGYSQRLQMTAGFDLLETAILQVRNLDQEPVAVAKPRAEQIWADIEARKNMYASVFIGECGSGWDGGRETLTRIRLLRFASHYLATGETLTLQDPYGTTLHVSDEAGKVKVWGNGRNCIDDQGEGTWPNSPRKDIVLEVPKRRHP